MDAPLLLRLSLEIDCYILALFNEIFGILRIMDLGVPVRKLTNVPFDCEFECSLLFLAALLLGTTAFVESSMVRIYFVSGTLCDLFLLASCCCKLDWVIFC